MDISQSPSISNWLSRKSEESRKGEVHDEKDDVYVFGSADAPGSDCMRFGEAGCGGGGRVSPGAGYFRQLPYQRCRWLQQL